MGTQDRGKDRAVDANGGTRSWWPDRRTAPQSQDQVTRIREASAARRADLEAEDRRQALDWCWLVWNLGA